MLAFILGLVVGLLLGVALGSGLRRGRLGGGGGFNARRRPAGPARPPDLE